MPRSKLTKEQREVANAALAEAADRYRPADRRTWHHRTTMLAEMRRLGLTEYRGLTWSLLTGEHSYVGRVFYHRKVRVEATADGTRNPVPPGHPAITDIRYELESVDGLCCLTVALLLSTPYQTPDDAGKALTGDLPKPVPCTPMVFMLRRDDSSWPYHRVRHLRWAYPRFDPVWFHTTSASIWPVIEQIWHENLLRRPLTRPLRPDSVLVRARVHQGSLVKVVTPVGSHVGYCRPTYAGNAVQSIFIGQEPHSLAGVHLPATPILEIVPWRWPG